MRQRREELARDRDLVLDVLVEGTRRARERAQETMERVRAAMKLDYWPSSRTARTPRTRPAASTGEVPA